MRFHTLYIILSLCLLPLLGHAQVINGMVTDRETREPVAHASLINKRTKLTSYTDQNGNYTIGGMVGDTLYFSHPAYTFMGKIVSDANHQAIALDKVKHELEEVTILSDMAKYKKDSADRHIIYRKTLSDAGLRPQYGVGGMGVGASGLFSLLALKVSGKDKKNKKFLRTVLADDQRKFTAVRYNPKLVISLTGIDQEEAIRFIDYYPMPYDYVRTASDLEIKAWIRENYKAWQKLQADKPIINNNTQR